MRLSLTESSALQRAVSTQRPEFGPRLGGSGLTTELVEQPWFREHRIVYVASSTPFPATGIHVVFSPGGGCGVLTGNPAVFAALVAAETPRGVDVPDEALRYANTVDHWTTESELGEMVVTKLGDLPLFDELDEFERSMLEELDDEVGEEWGPPRLERVGGDFVLTKWVLASAALIRREIQVTHDGRFLRRDEVIEQDLPVPEGRTWGMVGDRLVPTG